MLQSMWVEEGKNQSNAFSSVVINKLVWVVVHVKNERNPFFYVNFLLLI